MVNKKFFKIKQVKSKKGNIITQQWVATWFAKKNRPLIAAYQG